MDVEATVARRLAQAAGVPGCLEVPEEMPDSFWIGNSYLDTFFRD